jgi:2-aminoadipate transaminase
MLDCRPQNGPTDSRLQRMKAHALSELGHRTEEPPISWLMATALAQPHLISLAAGFTDNESLPVKEVRGLLDEILRSPRTGQAALQYGTTAGDPALRELTAIAGWPAERGEGLLTRAHDHYQRLAADAVHGD